MSQELNAEFTLKDCFLGAVKLSKNTDLNIYSYSGYGIGFSSRYVFSVQNWAKSVVTFGIYNTFSVYIIMIKMIS